MTMKTNPSGGTGDSFTRALEAIAAQFNQSADGQRATIRAFCDEVNRRAEANMLKTGKLEGSHYAAMRQLRSELGI
jgi:hypothetical protein